MIFVVDHERAGKPIIDIVYGEELETDHYDKVNCIFFCDNVEEVMLVVSELRNWERE
jgi:hypothetical protein